MCRHMYECMNQHANASPCYQGGLDDNGKPDAGQHEKNDQKAILMKNQARTAGGTDDDDW